MITLQEDTRGRTVAFDPVDLVRLPDAARMRHDHPDTVQDITKPEVLTIAQDDYEIRVARKDDFAMSCSFYDGVAQRTDSPYGTEVCSWDGKSLISHLVLPDSLLITNRFTMSSDGNYLRVITTASSGATKTPFTLHRFYTKFEAPPRPFNCIETLSMKRVCSTGDIKP